MDTARSERGKTFKSEGQKTILKIHITCNRQSPMSLPTFLNAFNRFGVALPWTGE
jgi:hypothetical protein